LSEERVVHRGLWLAPAGTETFRAGSTYVWDDLNCEPTAAGRAEIESRLREFLKVPFEVIDHRAAVRPVIDAGYPVLGRHPAHPQLAYFNGLGSKGSLLAPFFADQLAAHLCGAGEVEHGVNVRRFVVHKPPPAG
jgi:glycine/D-amino acid oxidase-like deaminating enzyme